MTHGACCGVCAPAIAAEELQPLTLLPRTYFNLALNKPDLARTKRNKAGTKDEKKQIGNSEAGILTRTAGTRVAATPNRSDTLAGFGGDGPAGPQRGESGDPAKELTPPSSGAPVESGAKEGRPPAMREGRKIESPGSNGGGPAS